MPKKPRTKNNEPRTQVVYAVRDQLQAMQRHPQYRRDLLDWREIVRKEKENLPLTERETALKSHAPRTRFSVEAEEEARNGLLSATKQELDITSEDEWAWRYAPAPELDAKMQLVSLTIPVDLPLNMILARVKQVVSAAKAVLKLPSPQRVRSPKLDPWTIYDWAHTENLDDLTIARQLDPLLPNDEPAADENVRRAYEKVRRARQFAEAVIASLDQKYTKPDK